MSDYRNVTRHARIGRADRHVSSRRGASMDPIGRHAPVRLRCQVHDRELWFAHEPAQLERAKELCTSCPARRGCLIGAVEREEHVGVWGARGRRSGRTTCAAEQSSLSERA